MFKRIAGCDTGSRYERCEGVMLVQWDEDWAEAEFGEDEVGEDALRDALTLAYTTNWCNHGHDCCGCWRTQVMEVTLLGFGKAMLYLVHTQNV